MTVVVHSFDFAVDDAFELCEYLLELFGLVEAVVVLVEDHDFSLQVTQREDTFLLQFGHVIEEVILFELLAGVLHLRNGLGITGHRAVEALPRRIELAAGVDGPILDFDLILESVDLQDLSLELGVPFDVALVYPVEVGVQGQPQVFERVIDLSFEAIHVFIDSLLFPADLGLEHFDVALFELEQL